MLNFVDGSYSDTLENSLPLFYFDFSEELLLPEETLTHKTGPDEGNTLTNPMQAYNLIKRWANTDNVVKDIKKLEKIRRNFAELGVKMPDKDDLQGTSYLLNNFPRHWLYLQNKQLSVLY